MRVLLTGSAGLIGSCLLGRLRARGDTVVEFDINLPQEGPTLDIRNLEQIQKAAAECDGIIHLAAISRVISAETDPVLCQTVNIEGTRNICQAARGLCGRPFVIFASSREVYGNPDALPVTERHPIQPRNVYGRSKAKGERLITELNEVGLNAAILRLPNVYGSTSDHADRVVPAFARRAASGGRIVVNGADRMFDFTHVEDVARAIVTAVDLLSSGTRLPPIHLASGIGTTLGELAQLAAASSLKPLDIRVGPAQKFDVDCFVGDPRLAKAVLGWTSGTNLDEGFRRLVHEFAESQTSAA